MPTSSSSFDRLFAALDLGSDGELSRIELHEAARRLGWHWDEAPLYAVLDALTIAAPLPRDAFFEIMAQMLRHPRGPYGDVLLRAPRPWLGGPSDDQLPQQSPTASSQAPDGDTDVESLVTLLRREHGAAAGDDYEALLRELSAPEEPLRPADSALLIIDPQRSFTVGSWARSVGRNAQLDVAPLRLAFEQCGRLLRMMAGRIETSFTRCPFPPDSYEWDERVAGTIAPGQRYFVKPGNSALWPPTNGFGEWVGSLVSRGKRTLIMGGCTLNSCVRVSASETAARVREQDLRIVVDLSLCGARADNYRRSPLYDNRSSVESAARQMQSANVAVVERVIWG